ncbi:MAG: 30S ribosomal protein S6 [Desulfobacteraceae bacterium 4572_123]|nr:MAG: 30S ribosomal protein S6 [Desulfobacteraceae bacterium 4572_123]
MRRYETIIIIDPDLSEEQRMPIFERCNDLIPQYGGLLIMHDDWGQKKLAYDIKKKARGYYTRLDYCGAGDLVDELERFFRIDDRVLKFMTVLLEKQVDIELIKEEMAQAEKAEEEAAAAAAAAEKDAIEKKSAPDAEATAPETLEPQVEEPQSTEIQSIEEE